MKIKIEMKKLLNQQIRPTLKRIMEKWRNPKDVYAFIRIAKEIDRIQEEYTTLVKTMTESRGIDIGTSKSVDSNAISNYLLSEHGKIGKDGQWTLEGVDATAVDA